MQPQIWDSETLERFLQQAEDHLVNDYPCLLDRVALNVVNGTSDYVLPDYVMNIKRVTWKGRRLDPLPFRQLRETFQPATQSGMPYWYVFNNVGQNTIRLFPIPNESVATTTNDLYGSEIANRCIVEYYRSSDYTNFVIPTIADRRIRKAYVLFKCFLIEGKGQDLKASQYYKSKWDSLSMSFVSMMSELHNAPRKLIVSSKYIDSLQYPSAPILPIDKYGISVDTGE